MLPYRPSLLFSLRHHHIRSPRSHLTPTPTITLTLTLTLTLTTHTRARTHLQAADPLHLPIASSLQQQAAQLRAVGSLQAADALALQAAQLQAAAARGVGATDLPSDLDLPSHLPSERELVAALSDALLPSVPR